MSWHIYLFWGFSKTTRVPLIIISNNDYGKYYPGVAARPEYGSVFRVSLPSRALFSNLSLDKKIIFVIMTNIVSVNQNC